MKKISKIISLAILILAVFAIPANAKKVPFPTFSEISKTVPRFVVLNGRTVDTRTAKQAFRIVRKNGKPTILMTRAFRKQTNARMAARTYGVCLVGSTQLFKATLNYVGSPVQGRGSGNCLPGITGNFLVSTNLYAYTGGRWLPSGWPDAKAGPAGKTLVVSSWSPCKSLLVLQWLNATTIYFTWNGTLWTGGDFLSRWLQCYPGYAA